MRECGCAMVPSVFLLSLRTRRTLELVETTTFKLAHECRLLTRTGLPTVQSRGSRPGGGVGVSVISDVPLFASHQRREGVGEE